jgi:hypothetical protein
LLSNVNPDSSLLVWFTEPVAVQEFGPLNKAFWAEQQFDCM